MAIPDYQSLMLPVLRHAARSELRVPELANLVVDELGISEAERGEMLPSGNHPAYAQHLTQRVILIDGDQLAESNDSPQWVFV